MTNILCWSDLKSYRFSGWGGGGGVEIVLVSCKRFMLSHQARIMSNTTDVSGTSAPGKRDYLIKTENETSFLLEIFFVSCKQPQISFIKQLVTISGPVISCSGCCPSLLNYYHLIHKGFAKIPGHFEKQNPLPK